MKITDIIDPGCSEKEKGEEEGATAKPRSFCFDRNSQETAHVNSLEKELALVGSIGAMKAVATALLQDHQLKVE